MNCTNQIRGYFLRIFLFFVISNLALHHSTTSLTNNLTYVDDAGTSGNYLDDLEDQSSGNYTYDAIGNLETDASEEIQNIQWNVHGKIQSITRTGTSTKPDLEFVYDALGQRIAKIVKKRNGSGYDPQSTWTYTYYVRDAAGNVMATYTRSYVEGADGGEVTKGAANSLRL
jgi:hypothetical protein